jgi:hypothetical protein
MTDRTSGVFGYDLIMLGRLALTLFLSLGVPLAACPYFRDLAPVWVEIVSVEAFGKRVFAVHATDILPENGKIVAGAGLRVEGHVTVDHDSPSFRPTVHFSLGGLVRPHGRYSWEESKYAVLMPTVKLTKQMVNLSPSDTFVLGDVSLSAGATLLVPRGGKKPAQVPPGVKIVEYDLKTTSLRQAIDGEIAGQGGWLMDLPSQKPGFDAVLHIEGKRVPFPEFAASFLAGLPHVSMGSHLYSVRGFAGRMGIIEQCIQDLANQYQSPWRLSTPQTIALRNLVRSNLEALDAEIGAAGFPAAALKTYQAKRGQVLEWLAVVDADLKLRQNRGVTFAGEDMAWAIAKARSSPEELAHAIEARLKSFRRVPQEGSLDVAGYLAGNSRAEFEKHFAEIQALGTVDEADLANLRNLYALKRTLELGIEAAKVEGLLDIFSESLDPRRLYRDRPLMDAITDTMSGALDPRSTRLSTALAVAQLPKMREAFKKLYEVEIPAEPPLTLPQFWRLHPRTRDAFNFEEGRGDPVKRKILDALGEGLSPLTEPVHNFYTATSNATTVRYNRAKFVEHLETLSQPMKQSLEISSRRYLTLYEMMKRGAYGSAEQIWEKLGLGRKYRERFPDDASFWSASESFIEIYQSLSGTSR